MEYEKLIKTIIKEYAPIYPTQSILTPENQLTKLVLCCPFCLSFEDGEWDINPLLFSFEQHNFFCDACDEEYSAQEVAEQIIKNLNEFKKQIEGLALLLPHLNPTENK